VEGKVDEKLEELWTELGVIKEVSESIIGVGHT
jgi:hypothetical protein